MELKIRVRETETQVIVEIGGTDHLFSKINKNKVDRLGPEYLEYEGELPTVGT